MNQEMIEEHLDKMLHQSERDIDRVFANRLKSLHDLLGKMFREHSDKGTISRSKIYAYNRFEKEMEHIKQLIHSDYKALYSEINSLMKQQYLDNYLMSGYVYEMTAGQDMGYSIPNAETIAQAILNPIADLTLPKLMQQHRNEVIRKIRIEIASGIQAGEGYATIAKRLEDTVNFSAHKARTVAITEAGRVQVEGRLKSAEHAEKHAKLEKYWMSTLDKKTRLSHRKLDMVKADKDGYFHLRGMKAKGPSLWMGPGAVSEIVNCRCDLYYTVNGKQPEVRRARNEDGSTSVIPYISYENWYKNLPKN